MTKQELEEAMIYATVNATIGFSLYAGFSLVSGNHTVTAVLSALGMGLLFFASYMVYEQDAVDVSIPDTNLVKGGGDNNSTSQTRKGQLGKVKTPLKKHPLCRFI